MRRGLIAMVAVLVVLPLLTFGMAYLIVDVPEAGRHPHRPGVDDPGQ